MHRLSPIVSVLVVLAYLAAAATDCEPSLVALTWGSGSSTHVEHVEFVAHTAHAPHSAGAAHAAHAAHAAGAAGAAGAAHAGHVAQAADNGRAVHAAHDDDASRQAAHSSRTARELDRLEWKPTCLCGCRDTRASVGGNTSRLGSTVPAVHVARLVAAARFAVPDLETVRLRPVHAVPDPIPI